MKPKEIISNSSLVAACGLYCGACRKYLVGKCPGCADNVKATWCKIRICCNTSNIQSCAGCQMVTSTQECKKINNFISKIFALLFKSDRNACVARIKEVGYDNYAQEMSAQKLQSIKHK